ncbi:hypothetical protein [Streptomyces sp. IB201691-2A2]|uniref:hypothetical protein n=1 Tax=Streptomyces sp. IB201691-2A2 TaxID=2561920 RepID=UPI00163DC5ED|nr:hypothetical protein [Streptomyces sp. IB201691-2A2]
MRWTTSNGAPKSGTALVATGNKTGAPTTVGLDDAGRIQPAPPTAVQARSQGAAVGAAASAGGCVLAPGCWWVSRVRLDRHRWAQWDRAWDEFDAHQGHRHA